MLIIIKGLFCLVQDSALNMRLLLIFVFALMMVVSVAKAKTYLVKTKDDADQDYPATKTIDGNMQDRRRRVGVGEDYFGLGLGR